MGIKKRFGLLAFSLLWLGCGHDYTETESQVAGSLSDAASMAEQEVFDLINAERAAKNLAALMRNPAADTAARGHSEDMLRRNFFGHRNPDGQSAGDRLQEAGAVWKAYGENLGYSAGRPSPVAEIVKMWMESPPHRSNILDESGHNFTETGIGVAVGDNSLYYITQLFIRP